MVSEQQVKLATEAYVYGFPLVFNLEQVRRYTTTGVGANPAAAFNTFSHAKALATPADTFVTINNDTVYSMAQLDLSVGPVLLSVPDTAERYYVMQFVDAWTNNFAYVGQRGTGTEAGRYLLVPPGWSGEAPDDATIVHNRDGGLTITVSHAEPADPQARANWLPAPAGPFRPVMRMYIPDEAVLYGTYTVQALQRHDDPDQPVSLQRPVEKPKSRIRPRRSPRCRIHRAVWHPPWRTTCRGWPGHRRSERQNVRGRYATVPASRAARTKRLTLRTLMPYWSASSRCLAPEENSSTSAARWSTESRWRSRRGIRPETTSVVYSVA